MTYNFDPRGGNFPAADDSANDPDPNEVPSGTVKELKEWVGEDSDRARRALAVENANPKPRASLVSYLEDSLNG